MLPYTLLTMSFALEDLHMPIIQILIFFPPTFETRTHTPPLIDPSASPAEQQLRDHLNINFVLQCHN